MIVRLTQLDGKLPNLALMRLASYHRDLGDVVRFSRSPYRQLDEPDYDRVYGSAIFDFSAERVEKLRSAFPGAVVGGSYIRANPLTVESIAGPYEACDYTDYPDFSASLGFSQRGCRFNCSFCDVPAKEGKPRAAGTVAQIWRGDPWPRHIHLLDNDFFGVPKPVWKARLAELRDGRFKVCFNQGINIRVITDEIAAELSSVDYRDDSFATRRIYTAWDNLSDGDIFFRGVERLERAGIPSSHLLVYMLVGFDPAETWERALDRFHRMQDRGMRPYPMVYGNRNRTLLLGNAHPRIATRRLTLGAFQRWAVRPAKLGVPFHEYMVSAKGWSKHQPDLLAELETA